MTKTLAAAIALLALSTGLAQASVRNYFAPQIDTQRPGACQTADSGCGKQQADAFCQSEGFAHAILFQRRQATADATATAFKQIKCYSPKGDFAGLQLPSE